MGLGLLLLMLGIVGILHTNRWPELRALLGSLVVLLLHLGWMAAIDDELVLDEFSIPVSTVFPGSPLEIEKLPPHLIKLFGVIWWRMLDSAI